MPEVFTKDNIKTKKLRLLGGLKDKTDGEIFVAAVETIKKALDLDRFDDKKKK